VLVGEALMRAADVSAKVQELANVRLPAHRTNPKSAFAQTSEIRGEIWL